MTQMNQKQAGSEVCDRATEFQTVLELTGFLCRATFQKNEIFVFCLITENWYSRAYVYVYKKISEQQFSVKTTKSI